MKRISAAETSSFDLFLDTICNTFGGIVFLAMLLAITVQMRSVEPKDIAPPAASPDAIRELLTELDDVSAKHEELSNALMRLPPPAPRHEDIEYHELTAQLEVLQERLSDATARRTSVARDLANQLVTNMQLKEESEHVVEELKGIEEQVDQRSEHLRRTLADQQETLRLPRERTSRSSSALLLLQGGTVYLARQPSLFSSDFNSEHVTTEAVFGGGVRIIPKSAAGWKLSLSGGWSKTDQLLKDTVATGSIVTIAVWPDSHDSFARVKRRMVELGLFYQLWPQAENEALTVHFGGGGSRVQ